MKLSRAFLLRAVRVKVYDPSDDSHGNPSECNGFRGEKRIELVMVGDGGSVTVTKADWTLTDLSTRPLQRSLIVDPDTAEQWAIDTVREHEPDDNVWDCIATLQPTNA